jgi:uncharacterized protein (DUF1499 family)
MKRMASIALAVVILLIGLSSYALYANQLPWKDPPGFWPRLAVYLSQNVAQTSDDATFPELQPRRFNVPAKELYERLPDVLTSLGWEIQSIDADQMLITAVIKTRWLRFRDDITLHAIALSDTTSSLKIHSASRLGRADYGANLGHILRLYRKLGL